MFRKSAIAAALLVFGCSGAFALGLGDISMKSALNQPMQAEIDLTSVRGTELSDIRVSLASLEAHQRAGLSRSTLLTNLRFAVEKTSAGNMVVKVTSSDAVREPYLEFLLELEWPKGRLLRQYTVLVDPPVTMPAVPVAPPAPVTRAAVPLAEPVRATRIPASSPAAPVAVPTVVAAAPSVTSAYGPIKRSDTLWSIAEQMRPDSSVTINQMMQALLRTNPDAFVGNNINHLKAGATLRMPERSEILAMTAREALAESRRQYAEWKAASGTAEAGSGPATEAALAGSAEREPPETAAAPDADAVASVQGAGAVQVETRLSLVAPAGDSISGAAMPGDPAEEPAAENVAPDLQQQLNLATEEAEASRAQSEELQSRVNELEKQIDTMKRLLELKDHALAQMQNRVGSETPAPETRADAPDAAEAGAVTPAPVEASAMPRALLSYLTANPLYTGIGAALAALLAGLAWFLTRRRDDDEPDDDMTLQSQLASKPRENREVPVVNVREPEPEEEEAVALDAAHDHDPLTEAEVFLAYGRIQQAEDTLKAAMQASPGNRQLQEKLLEVYHAAGNVAAFEQLAGEYRAGMAEDDERWLRVAEMGHALAPKNEMFSVTASAVDEVSEDEEIPEFDLTVVGQPPQAASHQDAQERDAMPAMPENLEYMLDTELAAEEEEDQDGVLASEDEVSTKLDLARAYLDMDDRDSARSILDEVLEEGNVDQKEEAERIIARLA